MKPAPSPTQHPWLSALQEGLDALEAALLQGDAPAVERASASVHSVLQSAPHSAEWARPGSPLQAQMRAAAKRFAQLRQAVLRANAQSQRAVRSLLPQQAPATYARRPGQASNTGGAGRAYLSA